MNLAPFRPIAPLFLFSLLACGSTDQGSVGESRSRLTAPTQSTWTFATDATTGNVSVVIDVLDGAGTKVTQFDPIHTMPMHLIAFAPGLELAAHEHPTLSNGTFSATLPFTGPSHWVLFDEYDPTGALPEQADRTDFDNCAATCTFDPPAWDFQTRVRTVDGLTFEVTKDRVMVGHAMPFALKVHDAAGNPAQLVDWLGAKGHALAVQEGAPRLYHFHAGEGHHPHVHAADDLGFGIDIDDPGAYRIFVQVMQPGASVPTTVHFDVEAT